MNKKYKSTRKNWLIIPVYGLIIVAELILGNIHGAVFYIKLGIYILISVFVYHYLNRTVAETKNGFLIIYFGIGLNDPSRLELNRIAKLERKAKTLLAITYDGNQCFSIELEKTVLDQLERDLVPA